MSKHTHFVSLSNNCIYPAMTSPEGYELDHPTEYRAATHAEIQQYKRGHDSVEVFELPALSAEPAAESVSPTTLQLADDDDDAPAPVVFIAPAPIAPAPVAIPPAPSAE